MRALLLLATAAVGAVLLATHVQQDRKDMDLSSYLLVKIMNLFFIPDVFPTYEPGNAQLWRYRLNRSKKSGKFVFDGSVQSHVVEGAVGNLPIKIFTPSGQDNQPLPVIVWLHGGGWFIGSIVADEMLCAKISSYTNMIVVSVDYRLAPEHVYPAALLDTQTTVQWVADHIQKFGGRSGEIYLMGESAGANLAAALTSRNLDTFATPEAQRLPIRAIALMYPPLASNGSFPSYVHNGQHSFLTAGQIERMRELYSGGDEAVRSEYGFAPLLTPKSILKQYPPTILVVAKHDVLADECLVFADKLRRRDVKVVSQFYTGSSHGFFGMDEVSDGDLSVRFVAEELRRISQQLPAQ